jgi:hypothetical protein
MDIEVICAEHEDIGTAFLKAVSESGLRGSAHGESVRLSHDLAHDLAEYIEELIVECDTTAPPDKPRFFQLAGHYVQVGAIATILQQPNGDVAMMTVNNGVINIDAFTWATMREAFESVIELKVIKVSSLVKGAS